MFTYHIYSYIPHMFTYAYISMFYLVMSRVNIFCIRHFIRPNNPRRGYKLYRAFVI